MLTDTLPSQLAFLTAAEANGLPVLFVELGNEFYNNVADNIAMFPTGADYGTMATTWMAAVRAAHPAAAISVVGVPSSHGKPRTSEWNQMMFYACWCAPRRGDARV